MSSETVMEKMQRVALEGDERESRGKSYFSNTLRQFKPGCGHDGNGNLGDENWIVFKSGIVSIETLMEGSEFVVLEKLYSEEKV